MKKKKWLIIIAVVLIMLVVPFSFRRYKDGGTRTYTALAYKIVDFNKFMDDGDIYSKTKIYPFPMNFLSDDFLMASANGVSINESDELNKETVSENKMGEDLSQENRSELEDIPETPPALGIIYDGEKSIDANAETYCWTYIDSDGKATGICADALHPLESKKYMKKCTASSDKIKVVFPIEPDSVTVRCWPESEWDKTDAVPEGIKVVNGEFTLKKGGYIYLVSGVWETGKLKGSHVSYSFYAVLK